MILCFFVLSRRFNEKALFSFLTATETSSSFKNLTLISYSLRLKSPSKYCSWNMPVESVSDFTLYWRLKVCDSARWSEYQTEFLKGHLPVSVIGYFIGKIFCYRVLQTVRRKEMSVTWDRRYRKVCNSGPRKVIAVRINGVHNKRGIFRKYKLAFRWDKWNCLYIWVSVERSFAVLVFT